MRRAFPIALALVGLFSLTTNFCQAGEVVTKAWYNHKGEEVKQWVYEVKNPRRAFESRRTYQRNLSRGRYHTVGSFFPIGYSRCYIPRRYYSCYRPHGGSFSYHGSHVGFHGSYGSYGGGCRTPAISAPPAVGYRR